MQFPLQITRVTPATHGYTCLTCPKRFKNISKLNRHTREVHTAEHKKFKCAICS